MYKTLLTAILYSSTIFASEVCSVAILERLLKIEEQEHYQAKYYDFCERRLGRCYDQANRGHKGEKKPYQLKTKPRRSKRETAVENMPSLRDKTFEDAFIILEANGFTSKGEFTDGGWQRFKHPDGSQVDINLEGRVVRTQAPKFNDKGKQTNAGQRVDFNGVEIERKIPHENHPKERLKID